MPQAQSVSINKIRADAVLVWRGFFTLALLPGCCPAPADPGGDGGADLPHVDLAPLRLLLVWLLVALTIAGGFVSRHGTASTRRHPGPMAPHYREL